MPDPYIVAKRQEALNTALRKERFDDALALYDELDQMEPEEPRWPHRKGDLYRRLGHSDAACTSYSIAIERYSSQGFVARAAALAKLVATLDPRRTSIIAAVDPAPAKALHRKQRTRMTLDQAKPLARAAEAADDEVRFNDLDGEIELELSDLELADELPDGQAVAVGVPITEGTDWHYDADLRRRTSMDLARLPAMPLFAEIPKQAFGQLIADCDLAEIDAGEVLIQAGAAADSLFVLVEGDAEVRIPGRPKPIQLGEGEVVGEGCLLDDAARTADVVARTPLTALRIPKRTLDEVADAHQEVHDVLHELLGRRLIANLLHTSPIFVAFDPASRRELARLFELRSADAGTILLEAGKRSDGIYCLLAGELEGPSGPLGRGSVIGQQSLLTHAPADDTVRCATEVMVLRLPRERFNELAAMYPPVLAALAELSDAS